MLIIIAAVSLIGWVMPGSTPQNSAGARQTTVSSAITACDGTNFYSFGFSAKITASTGNEYITAQIEEFENDPTPGTALNIIDVFRTTGNVPLVNTVANGTIVIRTTFLSDNGAGLSLPNTQVLAGKDLLTGISAVKPGTTYSYYLAVNCPSLDTYTIFGVFSGQTRTSLFVLEG